MILVFDFLETVYFDDFRWCILTTSILMHNWATVKKRLTVWGRSDCKSFLWIWCPFQESKRSAEDCKNGIYGQTNQSAILPSTNTKIQDFKRRTEPLDSGFPIGVRAPCWSGLDLAPLRKMETNRAQPGVSKEGRQPIFGTRSCSQGLVCYTFCIRRDRKGPNPAAVGYFPGLAKQAENLPP